MNLKLLVRFTAAILAVSSSARLHGQFSAIGFEGGTINNIPWGTNVGVPAGVASGAKFSYTFVDGNNLMSFRSTAGGAIKDSDDPGTGSETVPDYYKSPDFGWQMVGYKTTNNTTANWTTFNSSYIGNGNSNGTDYPGTGVSRTDWGEGFNINKNFSPAYTNLAKAPGLGDYFLDTHVSPGNTSQIKLDFRTSANAEYYMTLAFGGRDAGSENARGYYRLIQGNTVVFSGSTSDTPYEAYARAGTFPSNSTLDASPSATGVKQNGWEYFKPGNFNVTANTIYTLELLLPDELNFDFALGSQYTNVPSIEIVPVPEPATYGAFAAAGLIGLAVYRRRAARRR